MARILIENGRLWDGEKFCRKDILTEGERIVSVEDRISERADLTFDAAGKIVSAGLVDMHVHTKGIASARFGIHAEMSSFPFGVTAVNNAGSVRGDVAIPEICSVKNTLFVHTDIRNNHVSLESVEQEMHRLGQRALGIKVYFDAQMSDVHDITPLQEACDYAAVNGWKVMVHCSHSPVPMAEIVRTLHKGDILTHAYHGGVHSCEENDFEAFRSAQERGVVIDSGFAGNVHTDFGIFERAVNRGFLPDTISTDITRYSAYVRGGRYGMTMCMSIAKLLGMKEEDIFRAVTSSPAKALGKDHEWGYLRAGRCADIAVFATEGDGFDLVDNSGNRVRSEAGYRCVLTISDGQVVFKD